MRALAVAVANQPGQAGFSLRDAFFNEGPAGVANAVKKLWENVGTYLTGMGRYVFSGGRVEIASKGGEPITGRDLIALLATFGIDLGLLALIALNPPASAPARRDGLAGSQARLRLPTASVVRQSPAPSNARSGVGGSRSMPPWSPDLRRVESHEGWWHL
jgi:hypothetical protein